MKHELTRALSRAARRSVAAALLAAFLLLAACQSAALKPVELLPEDMCAFCRMALSERKYAAEFITKDGDAFKFDDLGCMADYIAGKKNRDQIAAFFVADFESKEWLNAETAHFVSSAKFQTPMSGGIVAFKDKTRAEAAAAANNGRLLSFAEVISRAGKAGE
ncbi:MAG TPA: nitrous oxide reductase accessory protein NosL [Blastocatellia bacterium]|nr:nitrous oxide reductase accessory protein NosL [Blastocatellia bacterium]